MITYIVGDATHPIGDGKKFIIHVCNDRGGWGRGFVLAISARWSSPERCYRLFHRMGKDFGLGRVQRCWVEENIEVFNMIAQRGYGPTNSELHRIDGQSDAEVPLQLDQLAHCLQQVSDIARLESASVHMPRIGCGLAGGKWKDIEPIIEATMKDVPVFVYDLA